VGGDTGTRTDTVVLGDFKDAWSEWQREWECEASTDHNNDNSCRLQGASTMLPKDGIGAHEMPSQ